MGANSKIEWTDATWSPVTGCTPISAGCQNCYAARMAKRLAGRCGYPADEPFRVTFHPERLDEPLHWRKPRRVFVVSMGDLFHKDVPFGWTTHVFDAIRDCQKHTFQILTKRPERMEEFFNGRGGWRYGPPPYNVWLGVTVENQDTADERIPLLLRCPAKVRFLSCEPLLGPVAIRVTRHHDHPSGDPTLWWETYDYPLSGFCSTKQGGWTDPNYPRIHWVIAGGESGPNARPSHPDWFRSLRDQCAAAGVPYFFKQWGAWLPEQAIGSDEEFRRITKSCPSMYEGKQRWYRTGKTAAGCLLAGREHKEFPA